ncbi:MAG: hypothetical protein C4542_09160 [Dehalococcoidia bacterium]|nr:MAG: hypothetical protein C4542_09160 [Dehalococcoidia bacterium]
MNKKLLILLAIALVVIPVASACGRTAPTGITTLPAPKVPHVVDVRFENCNACHVTNQLRATFPLLHAGEQVVLGKTVSVYYTNKDCISAACHVLQAGVTMPPPTTTKTTTTTGGTGTTTTGGTGTTGTTTTSNPPATLTDKAIAITTHNAAAMAAYKTLCQMCHAKGLANSNPYPPTWDGKASGSTQNTGVYEIVPGSPQDHTPYTIEQCTQAGCHAPPTS